MPFVAPKSTTSSTTTPSSTRTTFRPPWVKEDGAASVLKPTVKTTVPWAKKTTDANDKTTSNSILKKPTTTSATKTTTTTNAEPKKALEVTKKPIEPVKKVLAPVKKEPVAAIKKPTPTTRAASGGKTMAKKKEPTPPPSSSEEEEEEEEEEESEEETEEETEEESEEEETEEEESEEEESEEEAPPPPPAAVKKATPSKVAPAPKQQEEESELKRRFSIEKPKLRPVVVKRDKSMKKIEDEEEAVEGETDEDRERRLRFKLEKPKLRHVKREEKPLPSKSSENVLNKIRPVLKKVPRVDEILKEQKEEPKPEFKTKTLRKTPSIKRELSIKNVPAPPPLPSLVPKAPPPPPPPLGAKGDKRELTDAQKQAIEKLKARPRRRPDWSEMMKEVESGRKLRHVECNDRSQPILACKSMTKVDNSFIYETEKDNSHNKLLKQIQSGVRLKPTRTNDRSKPFIDGLRKFRRQMTIEEQLQKSQSKVNMLGSSPGAAAASAVDATDGVSTSGTLSRAGSIVSALIDEPSGDELDDIDKIRDDLQSTKQMLALELRNREAQERENKKLLAKIATLEAELEREKSREKTLEYGSRIIVATNETTPASEEAYVNSLKNESEESRKTAKDLEKKYLETGELLDQAKSEIEEQKRQIQTLEKKLGQVLQGGYDSRRPSDAINGRDSTPDFEPESESDPDEPEEKKVARRERRLTKEIKVLRSKLTKVKVKQEAAKKEKTALKEAMKKNHIILKAENKKFKKLEKEVHKMAASMKEDVDEDGEDDDAEDKEDAEEEESEDESEEESEESESEESENETESESEAEDATNTDKKSNLEPRVKKHESRFNAMKKCNVLLQANVDNLQDEIHQIRSKASNLQAELDAVLQDLGF